MTLSTNSAVPRLTLITAQEANNFIVIMRNQRDITSVKPGDIVYVDLRYFEGRWYESLRLLRSV